METHIQINPCVEDEDGISRCETPEAMFFGVYVGSPGGYEWVADFVQVDLAKMFAYILYMKHGYTIEDNT